MARRRMGAARAPKTEQVPAPCPPYSPSFHVFYCTENTCHFVSLSPSISEPTVLPAPLPLVLMGVAWGVSLWSPATGCPSPPRFTRRVVPAPSSFCSGTAFAVSSFW